MYRRETREVRSTSAARFEEDIVVGFPVDRTPIETWFHRERLSQDEGYGSPYIPSAFSESDSTTISLSSTRHLFIIVSDSEFTTDLT